MYLAVLLATLPSLSKAAPPPRTDAYGNPLPPGAVARFGSVRLRHAGLSDYVCLPDGKTLLTAGDDRVLRYWDLPSGRQLRETKLQGKSGPGRLITLSPDGKTLAAFDQQHLVFREAATGREIQRLASPMWDFNYLYFSPDGQQLAAGRQDYRVVLWDWRAGKQRELPLPAHLRDGRYSADSSTHATFSPDGKWLIAGANSNAPLDVFDVATGGEVHHITCHARTSAVSPDSKTLAVCSWRNDKGDRETVIRLFDLRTGKPVKRFPQGNENRYFSLAFSPDGKTLACGFSDDSCLLDLATGRILHRLTDRPIRMAFTPDGKTLLASSGYRLRAWDPATGKELHDSPVEFGATLATAVSPDGRLLATADWMDREVSLWDVAGARLVRRLPLKGEGRYVRNVSFSPDGRTVAACQYRGLIQVWDVATGAERPGFQLKDADHPHRDEEQFLYHIHLSPDRKTACTLERIMGSRNVGDSTRLVLWDLASGKPLRRHLLPGEIRDGAWQADGQAVALPLRGGLSLVDLKDGAEPYHIPVPVAGPAASPDGQLLAARLTTRAAAGVWEYATGKEIAIVAAGRVTHLALPPGNRFLVTADESALRVWDLADGKERRNWPLPVAMTDSWGRTFLSTLQLMPDGRRAFTSHLDGTGLLWDLAPATWRDARASKAPDEKTLAGWWADLAREDARRAYAAVWRMAEGPEESVVAFLRRNLRPASLAEMRIVLQHIEDLDSDIYTMRQKATDALAALGRAAAPAMRAALEKGPSLEVRRRLEKLLARANRMPMSPEALRGLRALLVLEGLASKDAGGLLEELAKGAPDTPLTVAAAAALERLKGAANK